jgi:hypothetical protein
MSFCINGALRLDTVSIVISIIVSTITFITGDIFTYFSFVIQYTSEIVLKKCVLTVIGKLPLYPGHRTDISVYGFDYSSDSKKKTQLIV